MDGKTSGQSPDPALGSLKEFLGFYERRGYAYEVGFGLRPAVLVIDFSVAFTKGTANFPGGGYDRQVAQTRRLLDGARFGLPVLFTTIAYQPHMRDAGLWAVKIPWIRGLQQGTVEVAIDERLAPEPGEEVIVKKFPSAFFGTGLDQTLRAHGVDTLIIAGCTTSACVRATTVDAMQHGYRTVLVEDAIGDITPQLHAVHLADLRSRYADVRSTDEVLTYLTTLRDGVTDPAGR
jgi:maleamate amidohydrolase